MASRVLISQMIRALNNNSNNYYDGEYYTTHLTSNGFYDKFIVCKVTDKVTSTDSNNNILHDGIIEVPIFALGPVSNTFNRVRNKYQRGNNRAERQTIVDEFDTITIPLYKHPNFYNNIPILKTGDAILKHIFNPREAERLLPFKLTDGTIFYGNKGMLLDTDGRVLVYTAMKYNTNNFYLHAEKNIVYINPLSFINKDLVSKTIITKLLPILMAENTGRIIDYVIGDKTSIIQQVIPPTTEMEVIQTDLNTVIAENADFIMDALS